MADLTNGEAPQDVFKIRTKPHVKDQHKVTGKINEYTKAPSDFFEPKYNEPSGVTKKWTEIETHFRTKNRGRIFDDLKPAKEYGDEMDKPLYSSFSRDLRFVEPKIGSVESLK